ncbi:hypothetical protein, partial [Streptomyces rochei]|uniref:hypothetical protein n=1 Tax=Streptomyces rochei TaxID=1928 RepID=UPI0022E99A35
TPDQLSLLVNQGCIDPTMGRDFNMPSALSLVASRAMLNQAIALGWRPGDELDRDASSNPHFINPLIRRMVTLPQDRAGADTLATVQMVAQRYHLNIDPHDHRSDSDDEDTLLAVADLEPTQMLAAVNPSVGVSTMIIAAAGKHERLVQALLDRHVSWGST